MLIFPNTKKSEVDFIQLFNLAFALAHSSIPHYSVEAFILIQPLRNQHNPGYYTDENLKDQGVPKCSSPPTSTL